MPPKRKATTSVETARKESEQNGNGSESRNGSRNGSERPPDRQSFRPPPCTHPDPEAMYREIIKWDCENVSTIDDTGRNSPTYTIRGLKWYIRVRTETSDRTNNEQQFSVYIYCLEKNNLDVWYADVLSNVTLLNRRDKSKNKKERFSYRFSHGLTNSGYASFIKMSELLSPQQGYIDNNTIKIEVTISVVKVHGLVPQPTTYNFNQPIEHLTDGVLVVGGHQVHISKGILATNSPVFDALFFRGFREAKQETVELEEVDYNEFIELLQVLYVPDREINPTNCGYLLKLADRFQIKSVLKRAEHFLCTSYQHPDFALATRLKLADEYKLYEAQHAILLKLQKPCDVVSLKNQRDYVPISDTMKLIVAEHQIKLMNKKP